MTAGTFSCIFKKYQLLIVLDKWLIPSKCLFHEWLKKLRARVKNYLYDHFEMLLCITL